MTSYFALLVFAGIVWQIIVAIPGTSQSLVFILALFIGLCANYLVLPLHRKPTITYGVLIFILYTLLHVLSYSQGGIRNSGLFYLASIVLMSYILLGKRMGMMMAVISILHVIYFYLVSTNTNWTDYSLIGSEPGLIDLDFLISGVLSILILASQANYIEKSKNAVIDEIKTKRNELVEKNKALETSQHDLYLKNKEYEQKNRELEEFVYTASHDLREPLRTTSNFANLLQKQVHGKIDPKVDSYIQSIIAASNRMATLINDLMAYSMIGNAVEAEKVDCNGVLEEVLSDLKTIITESGAEIKSNKLPVLTAHRTGIKQLFENLLANSLKFRKKDTTPVISIQVSHKNGNFEFVFEDNGIGIDKDNFERVFVVFQRLHTRKEYEGTGIGLAHCKKIVEFHNGKIWVDSQPGKGTKFLFTIPDQAKG
jgi:signal transduction histidine kinase